MRCAVAVCAVVLVASTAGVSEAGDLAETARFLAGKGEARTESYREYAQRIASGWKKFQEPNLQRMRTWWKGRAPERYSTVFYPFGGPDIANALALFPDADTYLLFGLEAPGAIPDLAVMDEPAISAGLRQLESSLSDAFQVNYFFTKAMEKKLGAASFNSVGGLLLFFLAMSDCEVLGAKPIAVSRSRVPGLEITFRRDGGKKQVIRYVMVNVADADLAKSAPDFLPYLKSQGRFVTMIKSASYLMHKEGIREPAHFEAIRALILGQSDFVVQDDSGVPLRLFARDTWKLQFHGTYGAPTTEFAKYLQKDLKVETQRNSTGKLPFSYGYAYKRGESNVMTAERVR